MESVINRRRILSKKRKSKPDTDVVAIDQSLSNCAMVRMDGTKVIDRVVFHTGSPSTKDFKEKIRRGDAIFGEFFEQPEKQVAYIIHKAVQQIAEWNPKKVALEGLAFNAKSSTERQLAGIYFGIIAQLESILGYSIEEDIVIVTPHQVKKIGRDFLPNEEYFLKGQYTSKGAPKLRPMDKKDMVRAVTLGGYGSVLEGYTRKGLVASRQQETGLEDLPDAICVGLFCQQLIENKNKKQRSKR